MTTIDRATLEGVAAALLELDLEEICSVLVETNGATGGVDVTVEGVPYGVDDDVNSLIFKTRKLRLTSSGFEFVA